MAKAAKKTVVAEEKAGASAPASFSVTFDEYLTKGREGLTGNRLAHYAIYPDADRVDIQIVED